jgi:hypothetical protein
MNATRNVKLTDNICNLRYRAKMLLAATFINLGDYTKVIFGHKLGVECL